MKQQLDQMLNRAIHIHGHTWRKDANGQDVAVPADQAVREFITQLASQIPDPAEQVKVLTEAWDDKTGTKMRSLNALRVEQVGNFIAAESTWSTMFFEQITLLENEEPVYTNETQQEVKVGHIGEDGTPDRVRVVKPEYRTTIGLRWLASQKVRYKTIDVYRGRVADIAQKQFDIMRDLRSQYDKEHFTLLTQSVANGGCFGAFSNTNSNKARRSYVAHSNVKQSRLPSTNDWDLSDGVNGTDNPLSTDTNGTFHPDILKNIVHYGNLWGDLLPGGGRLVPTGEIIVPSDKIVEIATNLALTNNTQATSIQQQVADNGWASLEYFNKRWVFIPDSAFCPDGYCFPRFNLLPGRTFLKPSLDKAIVNTNFEENWEERSNQKVYGACIIGQYRPRALRIKFA